MSACAIGSKSAGHGQGRRVAAAAVLALVFSGTAPQAWGCAAIPAPVKDIRAVDYRQNGGIDAALRARNDVAMDPIRTYARLVSNAADRFLAADDAPSAASCVMSDLQRWAQGKALLGAMANVQAERERAAIVGALAFAYLKTRDGASVADKATINSWLDDLASAIEVGFPETTPARRSLPLAGVASLAVGAATGNQEHWRFGRQAFEALVDAIAPDGTLETAMTGGDRVLFDQNIALGALVMMAELAAKQTGEDWYAFRDGAVHRLADRVLDGLRDPSWFAERSGKNQFLPSGRDLAWIAFYARRFPARFGGRVPDGAIYQLPRLGGDLTTLAEKWVKN